MYDWIENVSEQLRGQPMLVLTTIVKVTGSVPREVGAKMLVSITGSDGTIGGGRLEYMACQRAREMLLGNKPCSQRLSLALGAALGQCCGGRIELLLEVISNDTPWLNSLHALGNSRGDHWLCRKLDRHTIAQTRLVGLHSDPDLSENVIAQIRGCSKPSVVSVDQQQWFVDPCNVRLPELWVFGAGHVGQAVVRQLQLMRYRIVWIDQREDQLCGVSAPSSTLIEKRLALDPLDEVTDIPSHASVVVMTHSHDLDYQLCLQLLQREKYRFVGLIGSDTKSARFRRRLALRGLDESRIHCPIAPGLVRSRRPESIALAIAIQLTQLDEQPGGSNDCTPVPGSAL